MIRYWDYRGEYDQDRSRVLEVVDRILSSGRLILGPAVSSFEQEFAAYCGTRYGVGVNSGTDALFLALKALGVGPGDQVITVANTAVPTVAAIRATGADPVFVDVEEETCLMNTAQIEEVVTTGTKCIVPVHLFGQSVDMAAVRKTADRHRLFVVEDCAQATGALFQGKRVGSLGDIGAFSFYPTKVLGGFGDGGMAVTAQETLYEKLRRLRFYGMEKAYYSEEEGFNSRLDELQAALLDLKLRDLEAAVQKRRQVAARYHQGLAGIGDLHLPVTRPDRTHQFYTYTVRTARRDRLQQELQGQGIETKINYPVPIHLMKGYEFLGYPAGSLPVTERLAGEILSLPLYPGLDADAVDKVIDAVRGHFENSGKRGR